jgi:hypothetical protein
VPGPALIDNIDTVRREVAAWQTRRDHLKAKINWQFTTDDARIKLSRPYPTLYRPDETLVVGQWNDAAWHRARSCVRSLLAFLCRDFRGFRDSFGCVHRRPIHHVGRAVGHLVC